MDLFPASDSSLISSLTSSFLSSNIYFSCKSFYIFSIAFRLKPFFSKQNPKGLAFIDISIEVGLIERSEECDDGNTSNRDGCSCYILIDWDINLSEYF